ncbi:NYN domain-containing protein [Parapedobacter indicus]|uniref:OST-HTH/LOTUS domain-containing protein n=1 Tax=Parapedobacter indicus TaxID=1477437 RepID=A0A1I3IZU8_9SPHI|nr:NYN domain-containing protein [Parapedobacter indicus]PPL02349.1 OST-HTH/LOTUS domain-containing protein [Parapedobacter indicus]SFI53511.1 OST-HTH/LOTUS domain-containing protein [Parapedobacter indicus]
MAQTADLKIAVLIDADNVSSSTIENILDEVKRYGIPSIKRIYADWTKPHVTGWKEPLLTHAITPIQQYSYTSGKNSSDSALIIDAMDILHSHQVDGFTIVSSDSDFTRLAIRLRESGKMVIGVGEKKTPKPFIAACDKFIYIEILSKETAVLPAAKEKTPSGTTNATTDLTLKEAIRNVKTYEPINAETIDLLRTTVNDVADEGGWAPLSAIGGLISKRKPDFDPRIYGFLKLTPLFKSLDKYFMVEEKSTEKTKIKHVYIKIREPLKTTRKKSTKQ